MPLIKVQNSKFPFPISSLYFPCFHFFNFFSSLLFSFSDVNSKVRLFSLLHMLSFFYFFSSFNDVKTSIAIFSDLPYNSMFAFLNRSEFIQRERESPNNAKFRKEQIYKTVGSDQGFVSGINNFVCKSVGSNKGFASGIREVTDLIALQNFYLVSIFYLYCDFRIGIRRCSS